MSHELHKLHEYSIKREASRLKKTRLTFQSPGINKHYNSTTQQRDSLLKVESSLFYP